MITYNPRTRLYVVGKIAGDYAYKPGAVRDHAHFRSVDWRGSIGRDSLTPAARNTLGSTLSMFEPGEAVEREVEKLLTATAPAAAPRPEPAEPEAEGFETIREDLRTGPRSSLRTGSPR